MLRGNTRERRPCTVKAGDEGMGVGTGWRRCGRVRSASSGASHRRLADCSEGTFAGTCDYRDDEAVDALKMTVSMATS
jgi:hypothetical protein